MKKFIKHLASVMVVGGFLFIAFGSDDSESTGSSDADLLDEYYCDCWAELNTYRINSDLYQSCIDTAIRTGNVDDPYNYFRRKCGK